MFRKGISDSIDILILSYFCNHKRGDISNYYLRTELCIDILTISIGSWIFSLFCFFKGDFDGDLSLYRGYWIDFCPVSLFFNLLKGLSLFLMGGLIIFFRDYFCIDEFLRLFYLLFLIMLVKFIFSAPLLLLLQQSKLPP